MFCTVSRPRDRVVFVLQPLQLFLAVTLVAGLTSEFWDLAYYRAFKCVKVFHWPLGDVFFSVINILVTFTGAHT